MTLAFSEDIAKAKSLLADLPRVWDGKQSVLELKEANYQWKQMEWWGFYFEYVCRSRLMGNFEIPGERFGRVSFDLKGSVNWDLKSKAIKSDDHRCILNACAAIDESVERHGEHGVAIALCDVTYNDEDRSFQKWHSELKGGLSKYEISRQTRTSVSRYRKTRAELVEILFLRIDKVNVKRIAQWRQGQNSNGRPRRPKYMLNIEDLDGILVDRLEFKA